MSTNKVHDAPALNWVDRYAPAPVKPYLRLLRADRPVGVWLFYAPFAWSLLLASPQLAGNALWYAALFLVFAFLMRGAGCVINDIVDRDLDAQVERTQSRPLPSGQVSVVTAAFLATAATSTGLFIAYVISPAVFYLTLVSLLLVVIYPTVKRFFWWPQAFLALTFNWGILLAWVAVHGELGITPALLYVGAAFWTFAYDTVYAHQDKEDDAKVNIKSSALALGNRSRATVLFCYAVALSLFVAAGLTQGYGWVFVVGLLPAAVLLFLPVVRLDFDSPDECLQAFVINRWVGLAIFMAFLLGSLTS